MVQRLAETYLMPPVTGSVVVLDEGSILGSVTQLDFVGVGVTATFAAPKATITVPNAPSDKVFMNLNFT